MQALIKSTPMFSRSRKFDLLLRSIITLLASFLLSNCCYAEDADECFALASGHYQRGQWKQAVEYFDELIESHSADPRVPTARFYVAEALVQKGDLADARNRFEDFISIVPDHKFSKRATFRIAEATYLLEEYETAYTRLSEFQENWPEDELMEYVLPYLGQLEIDRSVDERGSLVRGIEHFEVALQRFPNGVLADECRFGLGRALTDSNPTQAKRFFLHVSTKGKESLADDATFELGRIHFDERDYDKALNRFSDFETKFVESDLQLRGLYWLGRTLARNEEFAKAKTVLDRVIADEPDKSIASSVWFEAAVVARQLDDQKESTRLLNELVSRWPKSEWVDESLLLLAQNEYQAKHYFFVIEHANAFLADFADSEFRNNVLELEGKSLLALDRNEESIDVFRQLLKLHEETESTTLISQRRLAGWNYLLGLAMFRNGHGNEAIAVFDTAANLTSDPAMQSAVSLAKSTILLDRNEFEAAIEPLEAFLAVADSESAKIQVRAELARALGRVGRFDRADEVFEELLASEVEQSLLVRIADTLAENAYRKQRFELAAKWFKHVTENSIEDEVTSRALSGLAWSLSELKIAESAVEAFERLIKDHPKSDLADEASLKLGMLHSELGNTEKSIAVLCRFENHYRDSELWPDAILQLVRVTQKDGSKEKLQLAALHIETLMKNVVGLKDDDEFLYQLAWLQNDLGDRKASEQTFKTISHRHRSSKYWADASYRVAEMAVREHRLDEAKQLLDQLINTKIDAAEVAVHGIYLQGKIAVDQQDWANVETLMSKLIDEHGDHSLSVSAEYWRAESSYRQRDFEMALERFDTLHRKNFEANKQSDSEIDAGIALRRAQLWAKKDAWLRSRKQADTFVKKWPEHASRYEAEYLLGRFEAREGVYSDARKHFQKVLDAEESKGTETAAMSQFMIGEAFLHQEDYDNSIKAYHKVEILHPHPRWQSAALLQCGKCYELKEEWHDAIVCYERLQKEFSSSDVASEYVAEAEKRMAWVRTKLSE